MKTADVIETSKYVNNLVVLNSNFSVCYTFNLTCPLTLCLFLDLHTGSFIRLKLLFLKFTKCFLAMDRGEVTCVFLDSFLAFDTIDHSLNPSHSSLLQSCPRVTFLGPDPTRPGETLTRPDPQLLTKSLTRPDPTRGPTLPQYVQYLIY